MNKLLSANFSRLKKDISFRIGILYMFAIGIIVPLSNFQTCRAACPPYVVPAFRHKQCMNPASLQFRLSLSRAILSMRISVHYRARRGEWRKTILSRKLICAVILFKHKQLRPRVRTLII